MSETHTPTTPARWLIVAALGAIYFIWGSTYLGIRLALDSFPPFLMAATRFLIPGTILVGGTLLGGAARPTLQHWRSTLIIGALLFLGGNGGVTWAEELGVPTGLVALMIGAVPLWMALFYWFFFGGERPTRMMALGLAAGMFGLALLIGPPSVVGGEGIHPVGALLLLLSTVTWPLGSLYARQAPLPASPLLGTGMQMLSGGVLMLVAGTLSGEWADLNLRAVTLESTLALAYLALVGSLLAFTAYTFLLRHTTPARATSYAYVNPIVAVILGWLVLDEPITPRTVLAAVIIIASVVVITSLRAQRAAPPRAPIRLPADARPEAAPGALSK